MPSPAASRADRPRCRGRRRSVRRIGSSGSGSRSRAIIALTSASSAALIGLEILALQNLARRKRERRVDGRFLIVGFAIRLPWRRQAPPRDARAAARRIRRRRAAVHLGQQQLHHPLEQPRIAPEQLERLIEQHLCCSCRSISTDSSAVRNPSRPLDADGFHRFQIAAMTLAGPTGRPAARSTRAKVQDILVPASRARQQALRALRSCTVLRPRHAPRRRGASPPPGEMAPMSS